MNVGQTIILTLDGNPTTGYEWFHSTSPILHIEGEYDPTNHGVIGSGGVYKFMITAIARGSASIEFQYMRSWEKVAVESHVLHICVK